MNSIYEFVKQARDDYYSKVIEVAALLNAMGQACAKYGHVVVKNVDGQGVAARALYTSERNYAHAQASAEKIIDAKRPFSS